MWGEGRLTPEFDAFGFRIGPAPRRALGDAAAFELRRNAKHGKDKLGEIARGIKHRLGQRTQARPGALHVAGDDKKIGGITREAVNGGDDDNIAVREVAHELLKLRTVGGGAGDLFAEHLFASSRLELGKLIGEVLPQRAMLKRAGIDPTSQARGAPPARRQSWLR